MENKLFRSKSMERVTSPEQLNDYIRVTGPGIWLVMSAIVILLAGICFWGIFGHLETKLPVSAMTTQSGTVCYLKEEYRDQVAAGMEVQLLDVSCTVQQISAQPVRVDETFPEYLLHVGDLSMGQWVYVLTLSRQLGEPGGIYPAEIVTERISPMTFIIN